MKISIIPTVTALAASVFVLAFGMNQTFANGPITTGLYHGGHHHHPHHDPYHNVTSGMLLGIYAQADGVGLRVTGLIPGYSAVGRLQHGDVLLRATEDGFNVYHLTSLAVLEQAKMNIGPNRDAAVEFYRPGCGLMYAWVTFTPIYSPAAAPGFGPAAAATKQFSAQFRLESEKPGCRAMFDRKPRSVPLPSAWINPVQPKPPVNTRPLTPPVQNRPIDFGPIRIQPNPAPISRQPYPWKNNASGGVVKHSPQLASPSDLFGRR